MNILEELYYGNIDVGGSIDIHKELLNLISRHEKELDKTFNESQRAIFEKFKDCQSELHGNYNRDFFIEGFVLGARIILDVMKSNPIFEEQ